MMRLLSARPSVACLALLALGATASAQALGSKPGDDTMYFSTNVGSFKLLPPGPDKTRGTLDMDFEGTVMVSGLKGDVTQSGNVRLELDRPDHERKVYFGKGHIHVDGEYRAIQFFGRNLKGSFRGVTVGRLYGEFDKNMETGYVWYASNPEKVDWGSYGHTVVCPPSTQSGPVKVKGKVKDVPHKAV